VLYANPAAASCAVVVRGRDVCLVRRRIEPYRGHWTLPAGFQEYDESPLDAAVREAREECGLEVEVVRLLDVFYTTDDARKRGNLAVFLARPVGGSLRAGDDALEAGFFGIDELPDPIGFVNNRRILELLRERSSPGLPLEEIR
jgi:8-oxo-dGTP diphosphatase